MEKKVIRRWEIPFGIIFISMVGSLFHFTYELSGYNYIIGSFSAVNESVWEHLKLVFFPLLIFSAVEYSFIKNEANNIALGKSVASYLMPTIIVVIFYSYEAIAHEHNFIIDIISYFVSIIVGQVISYKILTLEAKSDKLQYFALVSIIALIIIFVIFTFYPPHIFLFEDSTTGNYGIIN